MKLRVTLIWKGILKTPLLIPDWNISSSLQVKLALASRLYPDEYLTVLT